MPAGGCRWSIFVGVLAALACQSAGDKQATPEQAGYDPKYRTLTPDLLAQEPDSSLEWAVMQHIAWRINGDYDHERDTVLALTPGLRMVYATWWVEAEVNNGGYNQYFFNSTGQFADEALAGFRLLGLAEYAALMERAIRAYNAVRPRLEEARRQGTADAFSSTYADNPLPPLDDEFYRLEGLTAARVRYIRQHAAEFVQP